MLGNVESVADISQEKFKPRGQQEKRPRGEQNP
jgi:hypothetical protein